MQPPIAITGAGILGPSGTTPRAFWEMLLHPKTKQGPWSKRALHGYPVNNLHAIPEDLWLELGLNSPGQRAQGLAEFTVTQALEDAGLSDLPGRLGCMLATTTAGVEAIEDHLVNNGARVTWQHTDAASALPTLHAPWRGPVSMLSTACSSGLLAPAMAMDALLAGEADAMVAGGLDVLLEYTVCGFNGLRVATPQLCQPFGEGRKGVLLSEGAVSLCFESLPHAMARGARVRAVVRGIGISCDAHHVTAPQADGVARAMRQALQQAGVSPHEIGAVFAHGTGTQTNEQTEVAAMQAVWGGQPLPPVTSIKATMGHPQAAAGAFSLLAAVLSLDARWLPPISTVTQADPALSGLRIVTHQGEPLTRPYVMVNAFGFGGNNCVMVISAKDAPQETTHAAH